MGDALAMSRVQRIQDLPRILHRLVCRQRPLEGCAVDEFHHQVVGADVVKLADVGMIQRRDGAGLALEAGTEFSLGDLQRDVAVQPDIAGLPDPAHAALADRTDDGVRTEAGSGNQIVGGWATLRSCRRGGNLEQLVFTPFECEQRFDFGAQLVLAGTRFFEKGGPLVRRLFERGVIEILDAAPRIVSHFAARLIWRVSQILHNFQSRATVCGETPSTAAVSSTLNPPKKRISTTCALRASSFPRSFNASSSSTNSCPRLCASTMASSSETRCTAPPRFR